MSKTFSALAAALLLLVSALPAAAFFGDFFSDYDTVEPVDGKVYIAESEVSDGAPHYYRLIHSGGEVRFFVLMSNDGVLRAAFDACDVCFPEQKGYSQNGDYMVCNNCGQQFHEARINEMRGGCNPAPLHRTAENGQLVIDQRDILSGARYFR